MPAQIAKWTFKLLEANKYFLFDVDRFSIIS